MTFLFLAAVVLALAAAWFAWLAIAATLDHPSAPRDGEQRRSTLPGRRAPRSFAAWHRRLRRRIRHAERDIDRWARGGWGR